MDVVSISPFRTGSVLWRPRPDRWTLTVVCKGTYALAPGESGLASEQEEVNTRDVHWDDDDAAQRPRARRPRALQAARGRDARRPRLRAAQRARAIARRAADGGGDGEGGRGLRAARAHAGGRAPGGPALEPDAAALRVRGRRAGHLEPRGDRRERAGRRVRAARPAEPPARGAPREAVARHLRADGVRAHRGRAGPCAGRSSAAARRAGPIRGGRRSRSTTTSTASSSRPRRRTSRSRRSTRTSTSSSST